MKQNIPVRNHGNSPFKNIREFREAEGRSGNHAVLSVRPGQRPSARVLTQQKTGAAVAWVAQVPGEPGPSRPPGSSLSLLKCGEANIIAPEMGQRNIKTNKREI